MRIRLFAALLSVSMLFTACHAGQTVPSASPSPSPAPQSSAAPSPAQPARPSFALSPDVNPYTGLLKGDDYPEGTRGVAVMINNSKYGLPQSGLNAADLIYESVTEGGITRLMAVYRDLEQMPTVGPLRSARDQHVALMLPLQCLYAHIGGSTYALSMLDAFKYPNLYSIDGKYKNFYRIDAERRKNLGQEYSVFTDGSLLKQAVERYDLNTEGEPSPVFCFAAPDQPAVQLPDGRATEITLRFSSYNETQLIYDPMIGRYCRYEFGQPQQDMADNGQIYSTDNVFILFAPTDLYPDGVLTKVNFADGGAGLYLCGGRYQRVRWLKGAGEAPLRIVANDGTETDVIVNPGRSYIALVGYDMVEYCRVDGKDLDTLFSAG